MQLDDGAWEHNFTDSDGKNTRLVLKKDADISKYIRQLFSVSLYATQDNLMDNYYKEGHKVSGGSSGCALTTILFVGFWWIIGIV